MTAKSTTLAALAGAALLAGGLGPASAKGSVAAGEAIARQWCANCHVVAKDQTRGNPDVPTFHTIAKDPDLSDDRIETFLAGTHPVMPDMALSRAEIESLVAYIRTLKDD